jgi:glycine/D-amino acid oxidase-like deaminating enzyme
MSGRPGRADVLVVGGGVVGACVALELARRGREWCCSSAGRRSAAARHRAAPVTSSRATQHRSPRRQRSVTDCAGCSIPAARRVALVGLAPGGPVPAERARPGGRPQDRLCAGSPSSLELHAGLAAEGLATTFERRGSRTSTRPPQGSRPARRGPGARGNRSRRRVLGADEAAVREPALRGRWQGDPLSGRGSCDRPRSPPRSPGCATRQRASSWVPRRCADVRAARLRRSDDPRGFARGRPCSRRALERPPGARRPSGRLEGGKGITSTSRAPTPSRVPVFLQEAG